MTKPTLMLALGLLAAVAGAPAWAQVDVDAEENASVEAAEGEPVGSPEPLTPAATAAEPIPPTTALAPATPSDPVQPAAVAASAPESGGFRIGFWEIDFLAVDKEERGTTFRFLDFRIFRLFEAGQGPDYQAFSFFEMPELLHLFTSRREGTSRELRILDFEAIGLAMARQVEEDPNNSTSEFLKLPLLGPLVGVERSPDQPTTERQTYLFLVRRDVPR